MWLLACVFVQIICRSLGAEDDFRWKCIGEQSRIQFNGRSKVYLVGGNVDSSIVNGDRLTIRHGAGLTTHSSCDVAMRPESITQFKLLNKALSFNVDLSKTGCACNLAVQLTSTPARGYDGKYSIGYDRRGQPPYYCDASRVGGQLCPEIDLMNANTHAFQSTPHSCGNPVNGHYNYCDRVGCAENTKTKRGVYGPGKEFQIDTTHPFGVQTEFRSISDVLVGIKTILHQQEKEVVLSHSSCDSDYLAKLSNAMSDGMSLSVSYWGSDASTMAWLDSPPCGWQSSCTGNNAGDAEISNFTITTLEAQVEEMTKDTEKDAEANAEAAELVRHPDWLPDPAAPWECHHYIGNQQATRWCQRVGFEGGFEYRHTGGAGDLCGPCWCCKRAAKSASVDNHHSEPAKNNTADVQVKKSNSGNSSSKVLSMMQGRLLMGGIPEAFVAGSGGHVDGSELVVKHNSGFTIFNKESEYWRPENIEQLKLLGRTLVFTVDMRNVSCGCNLAFYLIAMPAMDPMGKPDPGKDRKGQPPYYCDANHVGGQWCPEIDIMEANNHAFQSTLHRCDNAQRGHYYYCDRGGCEENTRDEPMSYGPGPGYKIDTRSPFDVETDFLTENGVLSGMRTVLRQHGRQQVLEHASCNQKYLAALTEVLRKGMSLRITYWGEEAQTMAWMDVPPCGSGSCSGKQAGNASISNIQIWTGTSSDESNVWVVMDPDDNVFGHVLERDTELDPEHFAVLSQKGKGVAEWDGSEHFVQRVLRKDIAKEMEKARSNPTMVVATTVASTPLAAPDVPPRPAAVSSGYADMLMKKFGPESVPTSGTEPLVRAFVYITMFVLGSVLALAGGVVVIRRFRVQKRPALTPNLCERERTPRCDARKWEEQASPVKSSSFSPKPTTFFRSRSSNVSLHSLGSRTSSSTALCGSNLSSPGQDPLRMIESSVE